MIRLQVAGFGWDNGNREKCQKHGLSLEEIERFFQQENLYVAPDIEHSQEEQRFLALGRSSNRRAMFVVFTLRKTRGALLIRPISARYMHEREAKKYGEEESART